MVTGRQEPTFRYVSPAAVGSRGGEALEVARSVGMRPDPFQELAITDICGIDAAGKWAAFEAGVNMPRQNGKGGIIEIRELAGVLAWGERLIVHSSHEFQTSMEAMLRMEDLLAADPSVSKLVKSVSRSHGSEGFVFKSGQRLRYRTRTKGGGRGFTGETLVLDEAMVLQEMFIGALLPTLAASSVNGNPQVLYAGSAVDQLVHEHGVVFSRLRGRAFAGDDPSLVFLEWSGVEPFTEDGSPVTPDMLTLEMLADVEAQARANPGLGIRISVEHVEKELRSMDARTFAVERYGVGDWPRVDGTIPTAISVDAWDDLEDPESSLVGDFCFAFDVTPDRARTSIVACGYREDGKLHVELVEQKPGTKWVVPKLVQLRDAHHPRAIVRTTHGPVASLKNQIETAKLEVEEVSATELGEACGRFSDMVAEDMLRHRGQSEFHDAILGSRTRPLGDSWAWSRKLSTSDVSPLVAATVAVWFAEQRLTTVYADRGILVV